MTLWFECLNGIYSLLERKKWIAWIQFKSKDFDAPNIVNILVLGRSGYCRCELDCDESVDFCDSMSMCVCECISLITTFSSWLAFRSAKTTRLTTIVATTTPDKHTASVSISCGLPSIETLGTENGWIETEKWLMLLPLVIHFYSNLSQFNQKWLERNLVVCCVW